MHTYNHMRELLEAMTLERDQLKARVGSLEEALSDSNEMLYELVKIWQKKMPKSAQDVLDQYEFCHLLLKESQASTDE